MKSVSPLRYPGGKGNIYQKVRELMTRNNLLTKTYVEPFAGGFGIGLNLMLSEHVKNFIINDFDNHIYSFWKSVFFHTNELIALINTTKIDLDTWNIQKTIYDNQQKFSLIEVGFSTFFLNRTNYSGIIKGGPIGGFEQKGKYKINCRFNKERLIKLISEISKYKGNVRIYNYDVREFIEKIIIPQQSELFVNFDPPYVKKGKELYTNFFVEEDHKSLSELIQIDLAESNWIITYDDCLLVREIYKDLAMESFSLKYSAGEKKEGKELLIKNFRLT